MNDTVWIVGKTVCGGEWEVKGVFTDESQAIAACTEDTHFVGPIVMNTILPDETQEWPGGYYPCLQETQMREAA